MREPYTREELLRAIDMSERQNLTWPQIAARTGRTRKSLMTTVSKFRAGRWASPRYDRSSKINAEIDALIASGVKRISEIARRVGVSYMAMYMRLRTMGLDAETVREAAEMARMAA